MAVAPEMLAAPRGGRADDLKEIRGIGPVIETLLNQLGFWHFDQIAGWKVCDIAYVDERLVGFHGRISRDEWVRQAQVLAAGGTTEHARRAPQGWRELTGLRPGKTPAADPAGQGVWLRW